jgi:signal transduction histidine kinase
VAFAGRGGLAAGAVVGLARFAGLRLWTTDEWDGDQWMASISTVVLYAAAGAVAGFAAIKLREAERAVSDARAREAVARELHDGVLQTLAVVQRRSTDDELAGLARDQERELRAFLFGDDASTDALAPALRDAASTFERRYGGRVDVVVAPDLREPKAPVAAAVAGAVGEALANAGKHGEALHLTIYVEPTEDGGLFCSVKDDGTGFEPVTRPEGVGLGHSIRGRIDEVGGRVEVDGNPGQGTEVRLWVP